MIKKGQIEFINVTGLSDVKIVRGHNVVHDFKTHIHRTHNIGIIDSGKVLLQIGDKRKFISQGQMFFIKSEIPHGFEVCATGPYSYSVICLKSKLVLELLKKHNINACLLLGFKHKDKEILKKGLRLFEVIVDKSSSDWVKKTLILSFLEDIFNMDDYLKGWGSRPKDPLITKVRKFINNNWRQNLTIDELSSIAKISKFHFSRVFKREVGLSPYDYFLQLKIKKVQKKLEEKPDITEVTYESGFYDQSHLNKYFYKFVGINPSDYIKSQKKL